MDTYDDQLRAIVGILQHAGFSPSERGTGPGRFVFVEHDDRAVELYCDDSGFMVAVFEEPAEYSIRECHHDSPQSAAEQIIEWLSRNKGTV